MGGTTMGYSRLSPVWVFMCAARLLGRSKALGQYKHSCCLLLSFLFLRPLPLSPSDLSVWSSPPSALKEVSYPELFCLTEASRYSSELLRPPEVSPMSLRNVSLGSDGDVLPSGKRLADHSGAFARGCGQFVSAELDSGIDEGSPRALGGSVCSVPRWISCGCPVRECKGRLIPRGG